MSNLNIFVSSVNTSIVSRVVNCSVSNIRSVSVSIVREIKIKIQNKKKMCGQRHLMNISKKSYTTMANREMRSSLSHRFSRKVFSLI